MKSFRDFVEELKKGKRMAIVKKPVSKNLELAGIVHAAGETPVYFSKVNGSKFHTVANVFPNRELVCEYLGVGKNELLQKLIYALQNPSRPKTQDTGSVLENSTTDIDLGRLPIPIHAEKDGGPYISSAIIIAQDREFGRNCSFHRMMVIGKDRVVVRILPRHLQEFINRASG